MTQAIYFNKWGSRYPVFSRALLVFILFAAIAQFASFGFIQAHVISFYGAQPEDISFALQIAYVGIITTLPVQFRLVKYFNTRSYILTAFMIGILLNIGNLFVHDFVLFSVMRLLTGVITCIIAGCMLIVIFSTLPAANSMLIGVSLFFSLILTCGIIVGAGASWVVTRMDWTTIYYGLIGLQVVAIFLCITLFRATPAIKPFPLYQVDWFGAVLFMFGAVALAFVMIYGPKRYWFEDAIIGYATIFTVVMLALFLYRQASLKRPLIDLSVFRFGKFIFALLLMVLFFGIKDSINFIYGYCALILGWSATDVANLGLFNVAGVLIAAFIAAKVILRNKQKLPILLLAGFATMFIYHVWVYINFTPDLSFEELSIPVFLQGFACGLLFVPITIFCVATVPLSTGMTGIVIITYSRFIATLNSIAGFYTLQLNYNQYFKESFLGKLAPDDDNFLQRQELYKSLLVSKGYNPGEATGISNMLIAKSTGIQSQLLTIRAIFLIAAIVVAIVFFILVLFAVINKIKTAGNKNTIIKTVPTV